jgi:hypothetical protein
VTLIFRLALRLGYFGLRTKVWLTISTLPRDVRGPRSSLSLSRMLLRKVSP